MKKVIWRYKIDITDKQFIEMPEGAEILTGQMHSCGPCVWAKVNPEASKVRKCIIIVGTGHEFTEDQGNQLKYIDTFKTIPETLVQKVKVYHIFEAET